MKTKYFKTIRLSESGKKRFTVLATMPKEARDELVKWITELEAMPRLYTPAVEKICDNTEVSATIVADAVNIALDALSDLGKFDDSVTDFISDARATSLLDGDDQYSALQDFLEETLPHAKRIYILDRVTRSEDRGAPLLRRASSSVVIKPVFEEDFNYGKMQITEFHPSVVCYTTAAQIELLLQNRTETVSFQVSEDTLDRFLSDLLALQAEMKCARTVVEGKLSGEEKSAS